MKALRLLPFLLLGAASSLTAAEEPKKASAADRIQQLEALARRTHIKPFELLRSTAGEYPSERTIFRDVTTGTTIWKMSHNPGYNIHTYSNLLVWNLDGSRLLLGSTRPGGARNWLVAPDGSRWSPTKLDSSWTYWSEQHKDRVIYEDNRRRIFLSDVATGDTRQIWDLSKEPGELKLFRPSHDGKKLVVRQMHVPVSGGGTHSFVLVMNADGTGEIQRIDLGTEAGQVWFLKRADHSFTFNQDGTSGERAQWMCEPEKGGAIHKITPYMFYHASISPLGRRAISGQARTPKALWLTDLDTGESKPIVPITEEEGRVGGGHFSWGVDEKWFVGSVGNGIYEVQSATGQRRLICVPNTQHSARAESEPESSPDGTKLAYNSTMLGDCDVYVAVQRLPDAPRNIKRQGRFLTWDAPEHAKELAGYAIYRGAELLTPELISQQQCELPDDAPGYEVVAVERSGLQSACADREAPAAPSGLAAVPQSSFAVALSWKAPAAKDVSYYNVYCATDAEPACLQKHRVASPIETSFLDWGLQQDTRYAYRITAVDRAGNESSPGEPLTVQTPSLRRVHKEIEVNQPLGEKAVEVSFDLPQDDRYLVWIGLNGEGVASRQALRVSWDGARPVFNFPMWDYVSTGHDGPSLESFYDTLKSDSLCDPWYQLKAGPHRITLTMPGGKGTLHSVTVTNDAGHVPYGVYTFRNER